MAFEDYNSTNNADGVLASPVSNSSPVFLLVTGQGQAFPDTNFLFKAEEFIDGKVVKREILKCTTRNNDTLNVVRAVGTCRLSETSWVQQNQAQRFKETTTIITLVYNAENEADIKNELKLKAADADVIKKTGNQTITGDLTANNFIGDGSNLTGLSAEVSSTSLNYMLGDIGEVGKAYSLVDYGQTTSGTANDLGTTGQPEVAQSFYAQNKDITTIKLMVNTVSSPSDGLLVEIQTDNAGIPSGTVVTTSDTIDYSALSGTATEEIFNFSTTPVLTAETLYHIIVKRTGANDDVNYYSIQSAGADSILGTMSINTGSWANATDDLYFRITGYKLAVLGGTNFVGICQIAGTAGQIKKFNTGYDNHQIGLTAGSYYGYNSTTGVIESGDIFQALSNTEIINNGYSNIKSLTEKSIISDNDELIIYNTSGLSNQKIKYSSIKFGSFADGSDGDVLLDNGTTTLTRDMYYNNLTLNSPAILDTNGYKVYVKGIFSGDGKIQRNGNNGGGGAYNSSASGGAGGAALNQGSLNADIGGGHGGSGGNGANGISANPSYTLINGVSGGTSSDHYGQHSGGAGGTSTRGVYYNIYNGISTLLNSLNPASYTINTTQYKGCSGSGGGGADFSPNTGSGGGGAGGNGGVIWICANEINFIGLIEAIGGNGGNGGGSDDVYGGGGGGGQGGIVYLISSNFTSIGTHTLTGGTGGAGYNNGGTGNDGVTIQITI